ncbi:hypothetical protein Pcinc_028998 [Petrolisthes cinctipes]|uniref:Uncharacterized protein n=1 Tax=Petrolisthes cinctipes TaxID=88211 RepID=A0AAE1F0Z4_PETCI|nr:hypothetical protein Pcinc_028998 [Petrolisthes cinctipes]
MLKSRGNQREVCLDTRPWSGCGNSGCGVDCGVWSVELVTLQPRCKQIPLSTKTFSTYKNSLSNVLFGQLSEEDTEQGEWREGRVIGGVARAGGRRGKRGKEKNTPQREVCPRDQKNMKSTKRQLRNKMHIEERKK